MLQEPEAAPSTIDQDEGKEILGVEIHGLEALKPETVLPGIASRKGKKLSLRDVRNDVEYLWARFSLQAEVRVRREGDGVHLEFVVTEFRKYDRIAFRGMLKYSDTQAQRFLGITEGQQQTELSARNHATLLEDRYKRDGYHFASVRVEPDRKENTLWLVVDQGPLVKVSSIEFEGNEAFPASAILGLYWNLLGSAGVQSQPGWLSNAPFSDKTLEEDLDRLRAFYRGRGYKDARIELFDREFSADRSSVALTIRVYEGKLYRLAGYEVETIPGVKGEQPFFASKDLMQLLSLRPGQPVTRDALIRDRFAIERRYGRRGFPSRRRYSELDAASSLDVPEPEEVVDPEKGTVRVIFRVREGQRKRLRSVLIVGNRYTRDAVIRRELSVFPGDWLDVEELSKSEDRLRALQFFGDMSLGEGGVRLRLVPVEGQDDFVDLEVEVQEGRTGQILWGFGLSTSSGFFGNLSYEKRNFDWRRPPGGLDPIGWFAQILDNEAFHGGGQNFRLDLRPGTDVSQVSFDFTEPDLFGTHIDTIGLRLSGRRRLRFFESYQADTLGGRVSLERRFDRDFRAGFSLREERITTRDIDIDAPAIVFDAEGGKSLRSVGLNLSLTKTDRRRRATSGFKLSLVGEVAPEFIGGNANFWSAAFNSSAYIPIHRDARGRAHVVEVRNSLHAGGGIDGDADLFLSERLFMGGLSTLRGFQFRRAGPSQFGNPTGGELRWLGGVEYTFPLFSTQMQRDIEEVEIVRGVAFVDAGMLGDSFTDPIFRELRASFGFGFRIIIPGLGGLPLDLNLGWPLRREDSDRVRVFTFSFRF